MLSIEPFPKIANARNFFRNARRHGAARRRRLSPNAANTRPNPDTKVPPMYRYDEFDHAFVRSRTDEVRDQVHRRLSGELTEDQFKPLRLMNGVYLQLHAYMLRVAIPYGTLNGRQMRKLAHIARVYDRAGRRGGGAAVQLAARRDFA